MHAKIDLHSSELVSPAQSLPSCLQGLDAQSLADLSWTHASLGLRGYGFWPVVDDFPPKQPHEEYHTPELLPDRGTCTVTRYWQVRQPDGEALEQLLETLRQTIEQSVNTQRDERIAQGKPHLFPDGQAGTVQLRNERDVANVNALATAGSALVMAGNEEMLGFRDEEDATHLLTCGQAVELGLAVMQWVSGHYAAAWAHKDAIRALAEAGDVQALQDYDIDSGWPQAEEVSS